MWQYDAIVSEPWSQLVDLTLPLAITFAPVVAFLVHIEHLSKAHDLRRRYLNALAALGRIVFLVTPPRGLRGLRRVWMLVFEIESSGARPSDAGSLAGREPLDSGAERLDSRARDNFLVYY